MSIGIDSHHFDPFPKNTKIDKIEDKHSINYAFYEIYYLYLSVYCILQL